MGGCWEIALKYRRNFGKKGVLAGLAISVGWCILNISAIVVG